MHAARLGVLCLVATMHVSAVAQDFTFPKDGEDGFRRFIQKAQAGALGAEVTNANVSVDGERIRIELVRADGSNRFLDLTVKQSSQRLSRYFDIAGKDGATPADAERVGGVLDEVFAADPFQIVGFERSPDAPALPSIVDAWSSGGLHRVRMMGLASPAYVVGVSAVVLLGLIIGVIVICLPPIPPPVSR